MAPTRDLARCGLRPGRAAPGPLTAERRPRLAAAASARGPEAAPGNHPTAAAPAVRQPIFGPKPHFGIGERPPLAIASSVSRDRRVIGYGGIAQTW
jgi:hypothetical protein